MEHLNKLIECMIALHDHCIVRWKHLASQAMGCDVNCQHYAIDATYIECLALIEKNHFFNYQLWTAEDRARRDDKGYEFVYTAKREIDAYNQQRNNLMEAIDIWLTQKLAVSTDPHCPVHSETPGLIIDRLSILGLKIYHMQYQAQRHDVEATHTQRCVNKLIILNAQRDQLQRCLYELFNAVYTKTRTFSVYYQCKMYNDPHLNPELYQLGGFD